MRKPHGRILWESHSLVNRENVAGSKIDLFQAPCINGERFGVTFKMSEQFAMAFSVDTDEAKAVGWMFGDEVIEVNNIPTNSLNAFNAALDQALDDFNTTGLHVHFVVMRQ